MLPALWMHLGGAAEGDPRAYMAPLLLASLGLIPGVLALAATGRAPAASAQGGAAPGAASGPVAEPAAADLLREPIRRQVLAAASRHEHPHGEPATRAAAAAVVTGRSPATALPAVAPPPGPPAPRLAGAGTAAPTAALVVLPLVALLYITAVASSVGFFNVLMDRVFQLSSSAIGSVLAATQLLTVPVILWMAGSASSRGLPRVVVLAALGVTAGVTLEALAASWWVAGAGYVLMGMLNGVFFAAVTVYHQEHVHPDWRPLMSGAFITACALGWSLTTFAGGYVVVTWGYATLFGGSAVCCLTGTVIFAAYARRAGA